MEFKNQTDFKKAILGIIISDGCLNVHPGNKNSVLITGSINKELALFYQEILSWLNKTSLLKIKGGFRFKRNHKDFYRIVTRTHPIYSKLQDKFYQGIPKRKSFHPFLKNLSSFGLYLWFLGDGSNGGKTLRLHTENFTLAENKALQKLLKNQFDIQFKIRKSKEKYFLLESSGKNRIKFYKLLLPFKHLVPSMSYKFPTTEEIQRAEIWPEVRRKLPRDAKGCFISGSRHDLISQEIESLERNL